MSTESFALGSTASFTSELPKIEASEDPKAEKKGIIQNIHSISGFLSSFVIGVAGLIATSIYQCNQAKLAQKEAESQEEMARTQAENNWKIERAKILSQNLQALTARGDDNVEQRYGVLLSLTRGRILEAELSISYALELGKERPDYMRNVLSNVDILDYHRLGNAYLPTCEQQYGVTAPHIETCRTAEQFSARSIALSELIAEETGKALSNPKPSGPLLLLNNEREVQNALPRFGGLFMTFFQEMDEKRQWSDVDQLMNISQGAHLLGSLLTLTFQVGELEVAEEQAVFQSRIETAQKWLSNYLTHSSCNPECRGKIMGFILSNWGKAQNHYQPIVETLLHLPRVEIAPVLARLHQRLLWCQIAPNDVSALRDQVLFPLLTEQLLQAKPNDAWVQEIVGLLGLMGEPTDPQQLEHWNAILAKALNVCHPLRSLAEIHHTAQLKRKRVTNPETEPLKIKMDCSKHNINFCRTSDTSAEAPSDENK